MSTPSKAISATVRRAIFRLLICSPASKAEVRRLPAAGYPELQALLLPERGKAPAEYASCWRASAARYDRCCPSGPARCCPTCLPELLYSFSCHPPPFPIRQHSRHDILYPLGKIVPEFLQ